MYLIIYDITETTIRTKVSKLLERAGFERIQLSVFIGHFNPEHANVWSQLTQLLAETPKNKLFSLKITKENFYSMKIIGDSTIDYDYLTGTKRSLII
ncbi:MAG: CRISPR-associated endonuclease Cas2 [Crocinitomicaceae bacterium]